MAPDSQSVKERSSGPLWLRPSLVLVERSPMIFSRKLRSRTFTIFLAALIVLAAQPIASMPAHASTDWTAGAEVLAAAGEAGKPVLAMSGDGTTAVAAWRRADTSGSRIEISVGNISSGGVDWQAPVAVSGTVPPGVPVGAAEPQVSMSDAGNKVFVVWIQRNVVTSADDILARAGMLKAGTITWGAIVEMSDDDADADASPEYVAAPGLEGFMNSTGTSAVVSWYGFVDTSNARYIIKTRAASIEGTTLTPDPDGSVMHVPGANTYVDQNKWDLTVSQDGTTAAVTWLEKTKFTSNSVWPLKIQTLSISGGAVIRSSVVETATNLASWSYDSVLSADGTQFVTFWPDASGVVSWTAVISGATITPAASVTRLSEPMAGEQAPSAVKVALSPNGNRATFVWARWNDTLELDRIYIRSFTLVDGKPAALGDETMISDAAKSSYPYDVQLSSENDGLVTLDTYHADWSPAGLEAVTFKLPSGSTPATFITATLADSSTVSVDVSQAMSGDGSRKLVLWRSEMGATKRFLSSLLAIQQSNQGSESNPTPVAPVWVDPVLPVGSMTVSGSPEPGGVVNCLAPVFDPVATSLEYVWLVDGAESGRVTRTDAGAVSLTLPSSIAAGTVVGCRVTATTLIGSGTVAAEVLVKPAPAATPSALPVNKCKLAGASTGLAANFAAGSAKLSNAATRSLRSALGVACTGTVTVTGYVQPTKDTANDVRLARARAQAVVNAVKAQHPDATFRVAVGKSLASAPCAAAVKGRCAVIKTN